MQVEIKCDTNEYIDIDNLSYFGKDIKVRNGYDIKRMKQSIEKSGFICPLFIWRNGATDILLDGKTRVLALLELEKDGWDIGQIPVVYVEAKNETEAKEKVLQVNSRYGKITEASFDFFVKDANLNKTDFNIKFDTIHFENIDPYYEKRKETQEEIKNAIREGKPLEQTIVPQKENIVRQTLEQHTEIESENTEAVENTAEENPDFEFFAEESREIEICCPYCFENFTLSLTECEQCLSEVMENDK